MPSLKRVRSLDDDGEEVEVLESASSQLRATSKRPHLSPHERNDSASRASTAFDEDNPPSTQFRPHSGILEEYERFRDQVSVVPSELNEAYMEEMTQDRMQRKLVDSENVPAEQGILESIVCTNFMCHTKLEVKFGPLINFIIGHNGSGKSAVLTAITLCLGGKATSTNRGQSLKSFIKEGTEQTTLQVKIKNRGDDAFKRETYGDSIIVERHFNTMGTSGFKIKSRDGRLISSKRAELDEISDFFALQLDNPVNVLTQDMARQFLNSSTPAEKYKFFIKGVQLEQLDSDYSMLGGSLDEVDAQLTNLRDDCNAMAKVREKAQEQFERSERQATMRERVTTYSHQQAWAQIEAQEQNVSECASSIVERERRVAVLQGRFEDASQHYQQAEQTYEEANEAVTVLEREKVPLDEQHTEAKNKFDSVAAEIRVLQTDERKVRGELDTHRTKLRSREEAIEVENERLDAAHGGAEAEKRAEIERAKEESEAMKERKVQLEERIPQLRVEKEQSHKSVINAEQAVEIQSKEHQNAGLELARLRKPGQKNPWSCYDRGTEQLVSAIERETRFRERPAGPMGRHIRLLDPEWSSIIERTLGGALSSFVVSSKEDQNLLTRIMKAQKCTAPVLITKSARIHVNQPANYSTILKILEIDNELVRNSLIINQSIDQAALFKNNQEAMDLSMANRMPENVKSMLAMHPNRDRIGQGIRYVIGAGGKTRSSTPIPRYEKLARMNMSNRDAIESQEKLLESLRSQLHAAEQARDRERERETKAKQAEAKLLKDIKNSKLQADTADECVAALTAELDEMRPQDGHLDFLRSELEEANRQVVHFTNQLAEAKRQKEETALSNQTHKTELDRVQAEVDFKTAAVAQAQTELVKWRNNKTTRIRAKNEAEEALKVSKAEKDRAIEDHKTEVARLASWTEAAEKVSLRVPVPPGATYDTIARQMDKLRKELEHAQKQLGGSEAELAEAAAKSDREYKNAERAFSGQKKTHDMLLSSLRARKDRWKMFRTFITIRARGEFEWLLRERAFRGDLRVDHKNKTLDLIVQPDASSRVSASRSSTGAGAAEGRQTKTLSGGEKSFSTICMLLALWEAMGSPIRCLDEFDVFMDSVNRDISMKMMISAARQSIGRQYILITPQAMGSAELGNDVKVIRLSDPERGQTVLELPAAA